MNQIPVDLSPGERGVPCPILDLVWRKGMTMVGGYSMRQHRRIARLQSAGSQAITKQNSCTDVMAIRLIELKAITAEMTPAKLALETRARLPEVVQPDKCDDPPLVAWQGAWAMHGWQQNRSNGSNIKKMR